MRPDTLVKDCGGFVFGVIYRVKAGHVETARIMLMPVTKLPLIAETDLTGFCNVGDKVIRAVFPKLGRFTHRVWRV